MKFRDHWFVLLCMALIALVTWWTGYDDGDTDPYPVVGMAIALIAYTVGLKLYRRWRVKKT